MTPSIVPTFNTVATISLIYGADGGIFVNFPATIESRYKLSPNENSDVFNPLIRPYLHILTSTVVISTT